MYQTLLTEMKDQSLVITINRPDKLNALSTEVLQELQAVIEEVYRNASIRSCIITGAGTKSFVAGADIAGFAGLSREEGVALAKRGQDLFFRIEECPKPIVAAVNGFALGGGCELAMACHFRICSDQAKFGQPEVNLGLIPGYGGTQRMTLLIGKGKSMELMMTGAMIGAAEALQCGLVNYVTAPEELLSKSLDILRTIDSKAPLAIAKVIECVNIAAGGDRSGQLNKAGFEKERNAFGACFNTEDMKEGTRAFMEKRKPVFKGN